MTSVNIDDLCGFDPSEAFVAIFDNLFNVEFLNFIIEAQGLDLEAQTKARLTIDIGLTNEVNKGLRV